MLGHAKKRVLFGPEFLRGVWFVFVLVLSAKAFVHGLLVVESLLSPLPEANQAM
jgi:hypothetical protein